MESRLARRVRDVDVVLHTNTALCQTLDMRDMSGAAVSFGTMSAAATTLQMWASHSELGPFRRLYKVDGTVADLTLAPSTTAGRVYTLPDDVFGVEFLKIVSSTTNSTGTVGVVMLKS